MPSDVNITTNKQWWYRLQLIHELANWVYQCLNPAHATWGRSTDKKATDDGRRTKAMQYVIEHLALGKMLFPFEREDQLFTKRTYNDESMQLQLTPGLYPAFQAQVQSKLVRMSEFDPLLRREVSWDKATSGIGAEGMRCLSQLRNSLCEKRLTESQIDQEMIGLVLRYKCMSAFENNFYGSVPSEWGDVLSHYQECFASPLNHKFRTYYSMFEEDMVFGSKGIFSQW